VTNPTDAGTDVSVLQLDRFLPEQIAVLAYAISRALAKIYARYGLDRSEWRVLAVLAEGGELTAKAVGQRAGMNKTRVSRAVALLSARQLISKVINRTDLRETILSLTPEGTRLFHETLPATIEFCQKLEATISPEDREVFDRCIRSLQQRAGELAGTISDHLDLDQ
jgi:DNA-binding MarR family transcriptional regulator